MTRLLETRPLLQGIVGGQHWILNYITTSAQVEPEQCQLEEDQVAASRMLVQVCLTRKNQGPGKLLGVTREDLL